MSHERLSAIREKGVLTFWAFDKGEYWNGGVLEFWSDKLRTAETPKLHPSIHFSNSPLKFDLRKNKPL